MASHPPTNADRRFYCLPVSMDRWAPQARRKCLRLLQLSANQFSIKSQFEVLRLLLPAQRLHRAEKVPQRFFKGENPRHPFPPPHLFDNSLEKRRNFLKILRRENIRFNAKQLIMKECLLMFFSSFGFGYVCVCVLVFVEIMSFSRVINNAREREQGFLICFSPPFSLKPLPGLLLERSLKKHF